MRISCDQAEKLMIDYLDGTLSTSDHKNIEEHINACTACRQNLELQREWLEEAAPLLAADPGRVPALDLSDKIKAAVRTADQETDEQKTAMAVPIFGNRRPFWQKLAATAAAVVVLAVSVQVFIHLYDTTFNRSGDLAVPGQEMTMAGADSDMGMQVMDNGVDRESDEAGILTDETADRPADETTAITAAENWQIYTGSMAELPVGSSLFIKPEKDESEIVLETTESADDPELNDDDQVDPQDPATESSEPQLLIDLLCQASAIRVLTREGPPAETMIMAFWTEDLVDENLQVLSEKSLSWPYTIHLEKVSAAEEQLRLRNELGAELSEHIFADVDFEQWVMIKIRIGE